MSDLDPNLRRTHRSESSAGMWAGILLAAFVIVVGLILLLPKGTGTDTTATAPGSPPATTGSGTSGSGNAPSGSGNTPSR